MSRLKILLSLLMMLGLALSAAPIAAQDEEESALDDPSQLEGIESAVSRGWEIDFEAMMTSPEAEMEESGVLFLNAEALRFDSDDNAATAYQVYLNEGVASITSDPELTGEDTELTEEEVDLGDEAYQVDIHSTAEDEEVAVRVTFARDGNLVFVVFAVAADPESAQLGTDLLDYLVNEGEAGDGEGTFNAEGGSEGGLWDVFPPADHPALEGLVPGDDELLYPAPEEAN